ncbi:MAG: hypothetical protein DMF87_10915 [Acidobacteria bacterium]|nr:MAG: hypothetical protein DMF87_10915 [Acidobacteriota bacterium]
MRRVGRPPIGKKPRQLIAIRIDPSVLESFRKEARRRRVGYQTLINGVSRSTPARTSRWACAGSELACGVVQCSDSSPNHAPMVPVTSSPAGS